VVRKVRVEKDRTVTAEHREVVEKDRGTAHAEKTTNTDVTKVDEKVVESKKVTPVLPRWSISGVVVVDNVLTPTLPRYGIIIQRHFSPLSLGVIGSLRPDMMTVGIGISLGITF
jgi:hypothetical protein